MSKILSKASDGVQAVFAVVAFVAVMVIAWWVHSTYERWRSSVWAEEMRKAGVKTEVPK